MKWIITIILSVSINIAFSQVLTNEQTDSLINKLKSTVSENYVIQENIKIIADSIQALHYYAIPTTDSLIHKLSHDLFYFSNDKHLFIQYSPKVADNLVQQKDIHVDQNEKEKNEHYGFDSIALLDGHTGYFHLRYFADATHATKAIVKDIRYFKNTSSLIIDLRNNFGGSGTMIQLLSGIFLPGQENELLKINYRSGDKVVLKSTSIKKHHQYLSKPVYILCNDQTYSAGEAFAFIMKNRERAVIIGETTAGAGNVAGPYPLLYGFVITIPVGIIVDPITNTGWEHCGVTPNIPVDPAVAKAKAMELIQNKKNTH